MFILGFSGKKGSGKDTAAAIMRDCFPAGTVVRIAFADALKAEVANACGVPVEHINENKDVFRPILQWWGTEFRRNHKGGEDYWIEQLKWTLDTLPSNIRAVFITDVRFPNEAEMVLGNLGKLVRIESNRFRLNKRDPHVSETALDDVRFDYTLQNHASLEDFERCCRLFATKVLTQFIHC
jgi:hypothetical protein